MQKKLFEDIEGLKHLLYLISIFILLCLSVIIFVQSAFDFTSMDFLQTVMEPWALSLLIISGAALFICFFLLTGRLLSALSERNQMILTLLSGAVCITLQYLLLFSLKPVLRYDHLQVFDGAWEILRTGKLSLTTGGGYFGHYPFNIAITIFNSGILRIFLFLGIAEKHSMLALQCIYLFFIDLGVYFSWQLVRLLHSAKNAALFALLCFFHPILYVCAAGCYTTTLMLPLLMGSLLLIICFLREKKFTKKLFLGFALGVFLVFGSILRATVLIAAIALVIYLIIREKDSKAFVHSKKQAAILVLAVLSGSALSYGSFAAVRNACVSESYAESQMPPIYYLMFAANPETKGTYSEEDFQMISAYNTLEEKKEASFQILKERIKAMGPLGALSLANHKLSLTWSDGTEDYKDFLITSRNYSPLHSLIAGDHGDFFALYCHIYHFAMMGMFLLSVCFSLRRRCTSPYYLVFLTLLGGIIFHIFWESYYIYSLGFSILIYIPASDSICWLSEKPYAANPMKKVAFLSLALLLFAILPYAKDICRTEYEHKESAVIQDMRAGEQLPLLDGERITQTFQTERPFDMVCCKVLNQTGNENISQYRMELLSESGTVLASRDFYGWEIMDKDYCYMELSLQIPQGKNTYTIQITPIYTTDKYYLTFTCYNTHNYDIYADGFMTGLDSDEKSDLTFLVFHRTVSNFFHR